jgi:hypothetical protein
LTVDRDVDNRRDEEGGGRPEPDSLREEIDTRFEFPGLRFVRAFPLLVFSAVVALALFVRLLSSHYQVNLTVLLETLSR